MWRFLVSKEKEQDDVWTKILPDKIAPKDDAVKMDGLKKASPKEKKIRKRHLVRQKR